MGVTVAEQTEFTDDLREAFDRLTPQLSSSNPPPSDDELRAIIASPASLLLVARDDESGQVLGSLTLVVFPIPTGIRAWIEDVVVDEAARGQGVGEALNLSLIHI